MICLTKLIFQAAGLLNNKNIHSGRKYKCNSCDKSYYRLGVLKDHIKKSTLIKSIKLLFLKSANNNKRGKKSDVRNSLMRYAYN